MAARPDIPARRGGQWPGNPAFAFALPPEPAELAPLRRAMREWLADVGWSGADADDVVLAVDEAAANAVEHGCREAGPDPVRVRGSLHDRTLRVEVIDPGPWLQPDPKPNDRGRGLVVMRSLMDDVRIDIGEVTTVQMHKRAGNDDQVERS